jgi:hypothetical protein
LVRDDQEQLTDAGLRAIGEVPLAERVAEARGAIRAV